MSSIVNEPSFVVEMLEDFRNGGSARISSVRSEVHLDTSSKDSGTVKRKLSADDNRNDNSLKVLKLDVSPKSTRESLDKSHKLLSPSDASPWESHRFRSQLLDANIKISDLENQICRLHSLRQEMELVFHKDRESIQKQLDSERSSSKELENHLQVVRKREIQIKEELKECKSQMNKYKLGFEERIQTLQRENSKLVDSIQENEQKTRNERTTSMRHICHLKAEVAEKDQLIEDIKARNMELEQRVREGSLVESQLEKLAQELQGARLKIKELEKEREDHIEASALVKSQQQKVFHYSELEMEVTTLREENNNLKTAIPNKLLLEEMVQDLKTRQATTEDQEHELAWAQGRLSHLEAVLEEWYAVARDHCDGSMSSSHPPDPAVIRKKINELQQRVHVLTADLGEMKSQFNDTRQKKELLVVDLQNVKKEVERFRSLGEQHTNRLRLLQKKLQLVTMERDSYRSQLDTYEKDLTISCSSLASQQNQQQLQQQQRIETMEKILEGYRKMLEKVEGESDKTKGLSGNVELIEKLNRLENERDTLLQEKDLLQRRKDELEIQLEYRAIKGDFNPVTSKLLHFRVNPAVEAAAQYEDEVTQLQSKCARLEERIRLLQEGNIHDLTQKVEEKVASSNTQEVKELQNVINAQERKREKLKEVFHASIREFREVVYELFGYKVDRTENIYKLTNMYAESPDDHLMFKRASDGRIDMMETPFSTTLSELIDVNLHQHNSFPLFLGAITLDLFNRQTMTQSIE